MNKQSRKEIKSLLKSLIQKCDGPVCAIEIQCYGYGDQVGSELVEFPDFAAKKFHEATGCSLSSAKKYFREIQDMVLFESGSGFSSLKDKISTRVQLGYHPLYA